MFFRPGGTAFNGVDAVRQLKVSFSLNTMLGVGYILGLFTHYSKIVEIIYIVLNGLTGFFVLMLFGILNPTTRKSVKRKAPSGNTAMSSLNKKSPQYRPIEKPN